METYVHKQIGDLDIALIDTSHVRKVLEPPHKIADPSRVHRASGVAESSRDVRQPNRVLPNGIGGDKAERRLGHRRTTACHGQARTGGSRDDTRR